MLAKLQTYGLATLAFAATVLYALFKGEQTARYKDKAKTAHRAAKTLVEANKAIREADERVKEKLCAKDDNNPNFLD